MTVMMVIQILIFIRILKYVSRNYEFLVISNCSGLGNLARLFLQTFKMILKQTWISYFTFSWNILTLSVPAVLLNSPNWSPNFSLNKFERILILIFSSVLCLIKLHFLITIYLILYVLCKEKLDVDDWLGLKGLKGNWMQKLTYFCFNLMV